ncbi:MAG: DNA topoisomerase [Rikenellaceae bacterium]
MKVIIAEKPSVAREIARIIGATQIKNGRIEGNGYAVTWAFGHLITLAMPESYGAIGFKRENLPILPDKYALMVRQVKGTKGFQDDKGVVAQLKVIKALFDKCDSIIVATDAGREGELIFRYIYDYLNCDKPFERLWISSLTDRAITNGLQTLRPGKEYDNLYYAAKCRSQADWVVGLNATQAVSIAAGRGLYSLGRVQTPTLSMVCERYWERRNFVPQKMWQHHLGFCVNGETLKFSAVDKFYEQDKANELMQSLSECEFATVTNVDKRETSQEPPLLFDLTTLQKEANSKHGYTAEKTLQIAQTLYENKLITYPRTGSRYISEDIFSQIPIVLSNFKRDERWERIIRQLEKLNSRSVDDNKITDHHAILVTGVKVTNVVTPEMIVIYNMILERMLESFSQKCVKDVTTITVDCCGTLFSIKGSIMRDRGWKAIGGEDKDDIILPNLKADDLLKISSVNLTEGVTKPKPFHTDATLLSAMENAGKEIENDELRSHLKECGIGTPATRAATIETLIKREYIERSGKLLSPTEKGLALYSVVKNMMISNVELTGEWEAALAKIEAGELHADDFKRSIEQFTINVVDELLACKVNLPGIVHVKTRGAKNNYSRRVKKR